MKIKSIELSHFRNYDHLDCHLDPQLNVFIGANGQGKTNLLESMAFLSSLRSFRQVSEMDMIQYGQEIARIQCVYNDGVADKRLSLLIHPKGKTLRYQNQLIRKTSEFIGLINTVVFSPSDLTFFEDSPRIRRRFFDLEAGKLSRLYVSQMVNYNKVLKERNTLLKEERINDALLEVITTQLIKNQLEIIFYRRKMVTFINQHINDVLKQFTKQSLNIHVVFEQVSPVEKNLEKNLQELYKQSEARDKFLKATQKGIHRDDFIFTMNDVEISKIASQGQKRLILLALKLVLIQFIIDESENTPILLLDDVFSELDENHQQQFLKATPENIQTIITTTQSAVLDRIEQPMSVFTIEDGSIQSRRNING